MMMGGKGKEGKKEGLGDIIFGGRSKSHNAISCRVDECSPGCDCPSPPQFPVCVLMNRRRHCGELPHRRGRPDNVTNSCEERGMA